VSADHAEPSSPGALSSHISNLVVHLLAEYTGRGPTRARTHIDDDLITVVLHDTLTKAERTLVRSGQTRLVLDTRKTFQAVMRADLVAGIEALSGRSVQAFLSDNHIDPDIAVECFVLAPVNGR
jgi:uncharacterized protein YbcI